MEEKGKLNLKGRAMKLCVTGINHSMKYTFPNTHTHTHTLSLTHIHTHTAKNVNAVHQKAS